MFAKLVLAVVLMTHVNIVLAKPGAAWMVDGTDNVYNIDFLFTIKKDPGDGVGAQTFWAAEYRFKNDTPGRLKPDGSTIKPKNGGYMGIQTDLMGKNSDTGRAGNPDALTNLGKGINVGIWHAVDAVPLPGSYIHIGTDDQPDGRRLFRPYIWQEGHKYRLRMWLSGNSTDTSGDGNWWVYSIKDMTDMSPEIQLGLVKTPLQWGRLRPGVGTWTEIVYLNVKPDDQFERACTKPRPGSVAIIHAPKFNGTDWKGKRRGDIVNPDRPCPTELGKGIELPDGSLSFEIYEIL